MTKTEELIIKTSSGLKVTLEVTVSASLLHQEDRFMSGQSYEIDSIEYELPYTFDSGEPIEDDDVEEIDQKITKITNNWDLDNAEGGDDYDDDENE